MRSLRRPPLHHREIAFRLSGKGSAVTPQSVTAVLFAVALHMLALLTIRFEEPPAMPRPPKPTLVIMAESLSTQETVRTETTLPKVEHDSIGLGFDSGAKPTLPSAPPAVNHRRLSYFKQEADPLRYTLPIEADEYEPDPVDFGFLHSDRPVTIEVSGPLAELALLSDGLAPIYSHLRRSQPMEEVLLSYSVKVHEESGRVIWFAAKEEGSRNDLSQLAETILEFLRFDESTTGFIQEGTVDIRITADPVEEWDALMSDLNHLKEEWK